MTIVQINAVCTGSTGKICLAISDLLTRQGTENYIFYADGTSDCPAADRYMCRKEIKFQALRSRVLGNYGFNSKAATKRLLAKLDQVQPDIVHLHNVHGHNCHLGLLLTYLKERKIRVFWTFHDCWAFTAYCPHFDNIGCAQWKHGCSKCPQKKAHSWFFDRSKTLYRKKKSLLSGLDLTVITPSDWMADLVRQSFLKELPIHVIPNGIDLKLFRPCPGKFRKTRGLENKRIILGVASGWSNKKGLDSFIALSKKLDDRYVCVLVGTNEQVDQLLPDSMISIHRTHDRQELAEIYSDADVFFNPTVEDTYPTVNMEAIACGTPVVTYRTGGSPEIVGTDAGFVIDHDLDAAMAAIEQAIAKGDALRESCLACAGRFDQNERFRDCVRLYTQEAGQA